MLLPQAALHVEQLGLNHQKWPESAERRVADHECTLRGKLSFLMEIDERISQEPVLLLDITMHYAILDAIGYPTVITEIECLDFSVNCIYDYLL